jgi:penicillin amidase
VIGATIPGMPIILAGRSERLAWGLTAAYLDDIDLYVEELNPENPEEYRTPDGWAEFETRREIIEIDGEAPSPSPCARRRTARSSPEAISTSPPSRRPGT